MDKHLAELSELFRKHLEDYIRVSSTLRPKELYEPQQYILDLGGKRVRPLLSLIGADLAGADPTVALNAALAIELFHNFSLVHDDILDAAPLRRNRATVHHKWNTNIAILSGDMMLVKSFEVLARYRPKEFKQLCDLFTATAIEVCEGQQEDMNFESADTVSSKDYIDMITKKTAVLLGCSLQMGAISAGAGKNTQKKLYEIGLNLGIAFQLNDDLLDVYSNNRDFGKQTGGDILAGKKTFLLLRAIERSGSSKRKELQRMISDKEMDPASKIEKVRDIYTAVGADELCRKEAEKYTQKALSALDRLKADQLKKDRLKEFAFALLKRST